MKAAPQRNLGVTFFFAVLYMQNVRYLFRISPPLSEVVNTVYSSEIFPQKKLSTGSHMIFTIS